MYSRYMAAEASAEPRSDERAARAEIEACYRCYFDAFKAKDAAAAMAVLADGFTWKLTDGTVLDAAQTTTAIEEQMVSVVSVDEMSGRIRRLAVDGDEASVELLEKFVATTETEKGALQRLTSTETYRDLWKRTDKGWRLWSSELLVSLSEVEIRRAG